MATPVPTMTSPPASTAACRPRLTHLRFTEALSSPRGSFNCGRRTSPHVLDDVRHARNPDGMHSSASVRPWPTGVPRWPRTRSVGRGGGSVRRVADHNTGRSRPHRPERRAGSVPVDGECRRPPDVVNLTQAGAPRRHLFRQWRMQTALVRRTVPWLWAGGCTGQVRAHLVGTRTCCGGRTRRCGLLHGGGGTAAVETLDHAGSHILGGWATERSGPLEWPGRGGRRGIRTVRGHSLRDHARHRRRRGPDGDVGGALLLVGYAGLVRRGRIRQGWAGHWGESGSDRRQHLGSQVGLVGPGWFVGNLASLVDLIDLADLVNLVGRARQLRPPRPAAPTDPV